MGLQKTTVPDIQNILADKPSFESFMNYRYMATSFDYHAERLVMMYSDDGNNWHTPNPSGDFVPASGSVRDPAVQKWGEWFYITYTKISFGSGNYAGLVRTKDFITFEEQPNIVFGAQFQKIWAPEWYYDTQTGQLYIIFTGYDGTSYRLYLAPYNLNTQSLGTVTQFSNANLYSGNMIDGDLRRYKDQYLLIYKNEDTKYIEIAVSSTLDATQFTTLRSGDWAGWGNGLEGPYLLKLDVDKGWRMTFQNYTTFVMYYSESYDDMLTWSPIAQVNSDNSFQPSHWFLLDRVGLQYQKHNDDIDHAILTKATAQTLANNTVTTVQFDTDVFQSLKAYTLLGTGEVQLQSDGFYLITTSLSFDINATGFRGVSIAVNGSAVATDARVPVTGNSTNITISTFRKLAKGDKVSILVNQTSGGNLNLITTTDAPWFNIVKLG